jgi:hypothetical protein
MERFCSRRIGSGGAGNSSASLGALNHGDASEHEGERE